MRLTKSKLRKIISEVLIKEFKISDFDIGSLNFYPGDPDAPDDERSGGGSTYFVYAKDENFVNLPRKVFIENSDIERLYSAVQRFINIANRIGLFNEISDYREEFDKGTYRSFKNIAKEIKRINSKYGNQIFLISEKTSDRSSFVTFLPTGRIHSTNQADEDRVNNCLSLAMAIVGNMEYHWRLNKKL
jgi:hypothetical protein